MRIRLFLTGLIATALPLMAHAQPTAPANVDTPIVVTGDRPEENAPSVVTRLRDMIDETNGSQLARFEASICPMVIGMPRDLTPILTRIISQNIVEVGGELGKPGCKVNAAVIFIDEPQQLVLALHKSNPFFFLNMTPREFAQYSRQWRPVYSWHTVNRYSKDGTMLGGKRADATRLYTNVRDEMESGIVVIDRQAIVGKSLRQLGDFATMHLMVDVNWRARRVDQGSILSLFQTRNPTPPARMSSFDVNALSGFYAVRNNNYTAAAQRQNIARTIKRQEEGKAPVGSPPKR